MNDGTADLHFAGGVRLTPSVDTPYNVNSLTFDAFAGAFVINGNALTLQRGGIVNNSFNPQTLATPITLGFGQNWNAASAPLSFTGPINNNGKILQVTGEWNTIINSSISGTGALTKSGNASLYLGGGAGDALANTYSGLTTVNAGTLILDKAAGTVALSGDLIVNGGTVIANRSGQFSSASNVTLSGGTIVFGDSNTIGSFTANFGAYNTPTDTLNLTSAAQYALTMGSGLTLGSYNLTGASGGGINMPAGGSFSTTIKNLGLGGVTRTINVADGSVADDLVVSGVVSGAAGIVKNGPGTLTLNPANTYSGGTNITAGTIAIANDSALGNVNAPLNFDGGTLRNTSSASGVFVERPVVVGAGGAGYEGPHPDTLVFRGPVSGSGPIAVRSGRLQISGNPVDNTYNGTITVSGDAQAILVSSSLSTSGDINAIESGRLWFDGSAAANSNVVWNSNGDLFATVGNSSHLKSLTLLQNHGGGNSRFTVDTFQIAPGVSTPIRLTLAGTSSGPAITLLHTGEAHSTISGDMDLGGASREIRVADFVPGGFLTISGVISNGAVTKSRRGTLELTGANTYSGGTTLIEGTLRVSADNNLGAAGSPLKLYGIGGGVLQTSATFTLTHPIDTYPEISVDTGTTLTLGAGVGGQVLVKDGGGTLVVNSNTVSDLDIVNEGTLALASDQSLGAGPNPISGTPGTRLWMNGGGVRAEGGARNFANGVVVSGAQFTFDGNLDMTFNGPVTFNGPSSRMTVNNTTTFNGAIGPAGPLHSFVKDGPGTLVLRGQNTIDSVITTNDGTLQLASGALNSWVVNNAQFRYSGGAFNGILINHGTLIIDPAFFSVPAGISNTSTIDIPFGKTLSVDGAGLNSQGLITGGGTISGSGQLGSYGDIVPRGSLTLAGTAGNYNLGQIEITTGNELHVNFAPLTNTGTIRMAGGSLITGAQIINQSGGTISGRGLISGALGDSAGLIAATDGTLNIIVPFNNYGVVQVAGIGANLAGAMITNHGTVQGFGTIASPIVNVDGSVEAMGGTLILGSYDGGNLALVGASAGNKVLFTNGLAVQAGIMSIAGGTIDNNGHVMSNTGQISGYGVFRSGGLTNNGAITFAGGTTTVNGNVTNSAGKKLEVRFAPAVFTGAFTNNGIFKSTGAQVTFTGTYTENGQFISDPASNFFEDVSIGASGAWSGGLGDRFIVSGDLINGSSAKELWQTSLAELSFVGGGVHTYAAAGKDLGINYAGYEDNFAWGTLAMGAGDSLQLDGEAVYVGVLDLKGGLAQVAAISGNGTIYYDLREAANSYLGGKSYELAGGGMIAAVPEPGGISLLLFAAGVMLRRRPGKQN